MGVAHLAPVNLAQAHFKHSRATNIWGLPPLWQISRGKDSWKDCCPDSGDNFKAMHAFLHMFFSLLFLWLELSYISKDGSNYTQCERTKRKDALRGSMNASCSLIENDGLWGFQRTGCCHVFLCLMARSRPFLPSGSRKPISYYLKTHPSSDKELFFWFPGQAGLLCTLTHEYPHLHRLNIWWEHFYPLL